MSSDLVFACLAAPGRSGLEAAMLTASLRTFGGQFGTSEVWVYTPDGEASWSEKERSTLEASGISLHRFSVPEAIREFPFGVKVIAAAAAELKARDGVGNLVWMDADSLILSEPQSLMLNSGSAVGCRPVDHTLIGSIWEAPLEPFWAQLYSDLQVTPERLSPILTSVDEKLIRPYFNAGFLVVRPELGVLGKWARELQRLYQNRKYQVYFEDHILYRIFFHQAVLAGVLLTNFPAQEVYGLPPFVNYPLHMHGGYPENKKPSTLDDLTTARYDLLFEKEGWETEIPLTPSWRTWLRSQTRVQWGEANRLDLDE